jgi:hypothetical protein
MSDSYYLETALFKKLLLLGIMYWYSVNNAV